MALEVDVAPMLNLPQTYGQGKKLEEKVTTMLTKIKPTMQKVLASLHGEGLGGILRRTHCQFTYHNNIITIICHYL